MSEYADAGVDYAKIAPFKREMVGVARATRDFPLKYGVCVEPHAHGARYEYLKSTSHCWVTTEEGLGNKNWIAEEMRRMNPQGPSYYDFIAQDTVLMAANDCAAHGAQPVVYLSHVAAGSNEWFSDEQRAQDFARGTHELCERISMALGGGESSVLRYLVNALHPVTNAPVMSGSVTGIVVPAGRFVSGAHIKAGDVILGAPSSGIHANGISLIIRRAAALSDHFQTRLSNGRTLGEEVLIPTRSYVELVQALLSAGVKVHAFQPITGSGLSKIAAAKWTFRYRIHTWPEFPMIFQFIQELGVPLGDMLTMFNCGIGYVAILPRSEVSRAITAAQEAGYDLIEIGLVEEGVRSVFFQPEGMTLPSPEE
ncbi:MAG: hypothetical protein HY460_00350 [Parcubacteria group bacterium]|nr:hypothetical protein [Parcubacteria group bacterium]